MRGGSCSGAGGLRVLVLTGSLDSIAWMPCNPAIGGPGKAQVVREVDALGGEMGLNAERALTQIKLLNTSKGRAVQSVRTQCDKWQYSASMKEVLENQPGLTLKQERVERLMTQSGRVTGVVTDFRVAYEAQTVILTTGTYLGGVVHISDIAVPAGRAWDFASTGLSASLKELGFDMQRFNTGTTPRIDKRSVDLAKFVPEEGDSTPLRLVVPNGPAGLGEPAAKLAQLDKRGDHRVTRRYHAPRALGHGRDGAHRPAHVSEHRGEGPLVPGQSAASAVPRAGGAPHERDVRAGHVHERPAAHAGGDPADDPGHGARGDHAARLCHRLRLRQPAGTEADPGDETCRRTVSGRPD